MKGLPWTEQEIELARQCITPPGRTLFAMRTYRSQHGLSKQRERLRNWTRAEDELLIAGHRQIPGRTPEAAVCRLRTLDQKGVHVPRLTRKLPDDLRAKILEACGKASSQQIAECAGVARNTVQKIARKAGRNLPHRRARPKCPKRLGRAVSRKRALQIVTLALPAGLPDHIARAATSTVIIALLAREVRPEDAPEAMRKAVSAAWGELETASKFSRVRSLDAPMSDDDGRTLHDTVSDGLWA